MLLQIGSNVDIFNVTYFAMKNIKVHKTQYFIKHNPHLPFFLFFWWISCVFLGGGGISYRPRKQDINKI